MSFCDLSQCYPVLCRQVLCEGRIKDPTPAGLAAADWRVVWTASIWPIVLQRIQYNRMAKRILVANILEQAGYRCSCGEHLATLGAILETRRAGGLSSALLVCDLRSAFPRAWRQLLLVLMWQDAEVAPAEWLAISLFSCPP